MPGTPHADGHPEPGPGAPTEEIQTDIEHTRAELGETAEALATKLDVPRQAREKVDEAKQQVAEKTEPVRQNAVPIAAGLAAVLVLLALRRHRRRRRET